MIEGTTFLLFYGGYCHFHPDRVDVHIHCDFTYHVEVEQFLQGDFFIYGGLGSQYNQWASIYSNVAVWITTVTMAVISTPEPLGILGVLLLYMDCPLLLEILYL